MSTGYSVSLLGTVVDIITPINLINTYEKLLRMKVPPLFDLVPGIMGSPYRVIHIDGDARSISISSDLKSVTFEFSSLDLEDGQALFYLAYPMLEQQIQAKGFLTCHSACIRLNGEGILLLGKEGSGKTSLAIDICRRYDAQLVSNNFSVVGLEHRKVLVALGTRYFMLRERAVHQNMPFLQDLFGPANSDPWINKISIHPEEIGITVHQQPTIITSVYMVHVDNSQPTVYSGHGDTVETRVYLNENFSRYIRGTCLAILSGDKHDFSCYLPSYDCEDHFWNRVRLIDTLLRDMNMVYVSGPLQPVADWIMHNGDLTSAD